jgi:hypothetical protein
MNSNSSEASAVLSISGEGDSVCGSELLDSYNEAVTSLIRVSVSDHTQLDCSMGGLISALSQFGEIQFVDIHRFQFDKSFAIAFFDTRALGLAKNSIMAGTIPGLTLHPPTHTSSYIQTVEYASSSESLGSRSVDVIGFPVVDSVEKSNDFLLSVFNRFGEVESIAYNGKESFRVVFFDSRSPLSLVSALYPCNKEWVDQVVIRAEQLVSLLLVGNHHLISSSEPSIKANNSGRNLLTSTPPEFLINLRQLEKGMDARTTVMIRNVPKEFNQTDLIQILSNRLSESAFDFIYLPKDLSTDLNVGYAFVNLISPEKIIRLYNAFNNKKWIQIIIGTSLQSPREETRPAKVTFARIQGLQYLIAHFSKSSIMSQPDSIRPYFKH